MLFNSCSFSFACPHCRSELEIKRWINFVMMIIMFSVMYGSHHFLALPGISRPIRGVLEGGAGALAALLFICFGPNVYRIKATDPLSILPKLNPEQDSQR
jgi:hypothetical protein